VIETHLLFIQHRFDNLTAGETFEECSFLQGACGMFMEYFAAACVL